MLIFEAEIENNAHHILNHVRGIIEEVERGSDDEQGIEVKATQRD